MSYLALKSNENIFDVLGDARTIGSELRQGYNDAAPFPSVIIDDFLPPDVLNKVADEFPERNNSDEFYQRNQENKKRSYSPARISSPHIRGLLNFFNEQPFIRILENITGIDGLIPDPYFLGAGLHETAAGGHLSIHADFNLHEKMRLKRRINVIIYLNKDWPDAFGGHLELWDRDMKVLRQKVSPAFNRCVIFNTDDDSFHGHPEPLTCPEDRCRRSIALYYYTASDHILREYKRHTTVFKKRAGTTDAGDAALRRKEFIMDLFPPLLVRLFFQYGRKIKALLGLKRG